MSAGFATWSSSNSRWRSLVNVMAMGKKDILIILSYSCTRSDKLTGSPIIFLLLLRLSTFIMLDRLLVRGLLVCGFKTVYGDGLSLTVPGIYYVWAFS